MENHNLPIEPEWVVGVARQVQQSGTSEGSSQLVVVEKSVMYALAVIAALVTLLYVLCMYQYLRARLFRRFSRPDLPMFQSSAAMQGRVGVDEVDRVACLNEQQRRQVLEVILSETVVSIEDLCVANPVTSNDPVTESDNKAEVEDSILQSAQIHTRTVTKIHSNSNLKSPVAEKYKSSSESGSGHRQLADKKGIHVAKEETDPIKQIAISEASLQSVSCAMVKAESHSSKSPLGDTYPDSNIDVLALTNGCDQAIVDPSVSQRILTGNEVADGEPRGEVDGPMPHGKVIAQPRPPTHLTLSSAYTYDDDSPDGDNPCPICLAGYRVGDVLVSSKHCSHNFHKDCVLQWLERNTNCPVCRAEMVTHTEMNQAATALVGKTRMIRAVAAAQRRPSASRSSVAAANRRSAASAMRPLSVAGPSFGAAMVVPPGSYV